MNFYQRRVRLVFLCVVALISIATDVFAGLRVHPSIRVTLRIALEQRHTSVVTRSMWICKITPSTELIPTVSRSFWIGHSIFNSQKTEFTTGAGSGVVAGPMLYKRFSGYGNANDGHPKFDLYPFEQSYMHSRAIDLRKSGIFLSIMLFDVYAFPAGGNGARRTETWDRRERRSNCE